MKIVITGGKGQLAQALKDQSTLHELVCLSKEDMDIANAITVTQVLDNIKPDAIINAAAYTKVDDAEDQEELAFLINSIGTLNIARYAAAKKIPLVHISTDYVFNGEGATPYKVSDETDPIGVYGESKLAGELALIDAYPDACVIRTSWLWYTSHHNFYNTMKRLGAERDSLTVVNDQVGVPTFAGDLAEVCLLAIEKYSDLSKGIYHFQNQSPCTWFDFATEIMKHHQLECVVQPVSSDQFPTKAKRPSYSVLDCSKIAKELDLHIRSWKETLNAL